MELRAYGAVLKRHARLIGLITLATLILSIGLALRGPSAYTASMRLAISVVPDPRVGDFFKFDSYYSVLTSEYLADDLSELLRSEAFAADVSAEMGNTIEPEAIVNLTRTKKTHRLLDIQIASGDPQTAMAIAQAYERVLNTKLDQLPGVPAGEQRLRPDRQPAEGYPHQHAAADRRRDRPADDGRPARRGRAGVPPRIRRRPTPRPPSG